jgi:hypothetical protein
VILNEVDMLDGKDIKLRDLIRVDCIRGKGQMVTETDTEPDHRGVYNRLETYLYRGKYYIFTLRCKEKEIKNINYVTFHKREAKEKAENLIWQKWLNKKNNIYFTNRYAEIHKQ